MTAEDPGIAQARASDPGHSVWVAANAGSGKTKVLTDRVARLLLSGVDPASVLCLTYTKAAAAEMQNRLFGRLGGWAMLPEDRLRAQLEALGARGAGTDRARRLFAQAIEVPGGLRIQTIHAFCAALLRRFPLEAGVSPQFTEIDDLSAAELRAACFDALAEDEGALAAEFAGLWTGAKIDAFLSRLTGLRTAFGGAEDPAALARLHGVRDGDSLDRLLDETLGGTTRELAAEAAAHLAKGRATDLKLAEALAALADGPPDAAVLARLEGVMIYKTGARAGMAKADALPTKDTRPLMLPLLAPLHALMERVARGRERRLALEAAARTALLHRFARGFLARYAAAKEARGWLDFDDLILKTRALLTAPGVGDWVRWRLDGGVSHILVDEAQDTSPLQWAVVQALIEGFGGADGRTLFVVGDRKQSIYGFQGADLRVFDAQRRAFADRLDGLGAPMRAEPLLHSFRSAPAVLRLVDTLLPEGPPDGAGHLAHFQAMPGEVELLPPVVARKDAVPDDGLQDRVTDRDAVEVLAETLARRLRAMIDAGTPVALRRAGGGTRPMTAGDVLVLLRSRSALFGAVIRACKRVGLPVAGADRMRLTSELAVQDVLAVLAFLALPQDDLSLAAALRSPLFGWSEAGLFRLAQGREGTLWDRLRLTDDPAAAVLRDLRDRSDFLRPFELIERLLGRHGGRKRLLARLGAEAEEGLDVLRAQALAYERSEVPSLTGFLAWLAAGEVEVKRSAEAAGDRLRVMTIHGAKGLEAPVVVLPDTGPRRDPPAAPLLVMPGGQAVWRGKAETQPEPLRGALAAEAEADAAEELRLLYVALTRAESRVLVGGILPEGEVPPDCWYGRLQGAMERAGAVAAEAGGLRLVSGTWAAPEVPGAPSGVDGASVPPAWAEAAAPPKSRPPQPVSPSGLGGAKALPGEGEETAAALAHGTAVHRLLERLPGLSAEEAAAVGADPAARAEALAVLAAPHLAHVFDAEGLAEVAITADLGGRRMLGAIDRLLVWPDRVLAVDFKTNRQVPAGPAEVPEGLLRQMGAYAAALAQVFPGRQVQTAILWTRTAALMPLPHDIVRAALDRATKP